MQNVSFSSTSYKRIDNKYQNSAVMIQKNSNIQVAYVYSFGNGIDASLAIKNLKNTPVTIMALFQIIGSSGGFATAGYHKPTRFGLSDSSFTLLPSNDRVASFDLLSVNWQNEASIYSASSFLTIGKTTSLSVQFNPVYLTHNETYTIDPLISESPPVVGHRDQATAAPMSCPGGVCGGGGGDTTDYDGDTDPDNDAPPPPPPSPPSGLTVHLSQDSLAANLLVNNNPPSTTIWANLTSAGSGNVEITVEGINYTNGHVTYLNQTNVGSSLHNKFVWTNPMISKMIFSTSVGVANNGSLSLYKGTTSLEYGVSVYSVAVT